MVHHGIPGKCSSWPGLTRPSTFVRRQLSGKTGAGGAAWMPGSSPGMTQSVGRQPSPLIRDEPFSCRIAHHATVKTIPAFRHDSIRRKSETGKTAAIRPPPGKRTNQRTIIMRQRHCRNMPFTPRKAALDADRHPAHIAAAPDGRTAAPRLDLGEESPGSTEVRCRITSGGGDPRESATESKPPFHKAPALF